MARAPGGVIQVDQEVATEDHIIARLAGEERRIEDVPLHEADALAHVGIDLMAPGTLSKVPPPIGLVVAPEGILREDAAAGELDPPAC